MLRRILRALLYTYALYLTICLLIVMPAMNVMAPRLVLEHTNRELRSEILLFNPFTLAIDLRGLSFHEQDGHQPLALKRVIQDLSLSSLWQPGIVLDRLWIEGLDVHVLRYADGDFHFADLVTTEAETDTEPDTVDDEITAITIRDVRIDADELTFTDMSRPGPYRSVQRDLLIQTRNLTTLPGRKGDGELVLISDGGGRLSWRGDLSIAEGESSGRLTLENIDLTPLWRYEAESLDFVAENARMDLSFDYRATWSDAVDAQISNGKFRLRDIHVVAADSERFPDTGISLEELSLDAIGMSLADQSAEAASLALIGLSISGFDEDEVVSLRDIFAGPTATAEAAEPGSADGSSAATPEESGGEWSLHLAEFSLDNSQLQWSTPYLSPDRMVIAPLRFKASGLSWPAQEASQVELEFLINDQSRLSVGGAMHLGTGHGELATELSALQLAWLHPLIHEQVRTDLDRGQFNLSARVILDDFSPATVALDASIVDLGTVLHETGEEAFAAERFEVTDANVAVADEEVRIETLRLQSPRGSLQILEDGSINVNGIVRSGPSAEEEAEYPDVDEAGWRVVIANAELLGGRLDFADDSLPLPFKTMIEGIEAQVADIDTAAETPLRVTLNGNVDGYAPVIIEGSGTPHAQESDGEMRFRFRGVDIATMSPYSGTYAGYTIASGTLSLDLRYALAGARIDGDNRIVISQMELGEPVSSDLAVEVPLKLGIALLTDANGVIDLSVPVSGDVDDPEFSLSQVIGRAVMNVITKAVTAPFRLLAGLVGSEEDLENIAYNAGSSELNTEAEDTLASLSQALNQRPQLALRVVGSADPVTDSAVLKERQLEAELIEQGLTAESLSARDEAWAAAVAKRFDALVKESPETGTEEAESEGQESEPPTPEEQWQALLSTIELPANALQELGTERAAAAKRELVTIGGIDAARIAISYSAEPAASGVRMELDT